MDRPVRIALFGLIRAESGRGMAPVAGTKLQTALAMLALAAPHPVSDDQLVEALWGDDHRANPANSLHAQILVLRRLLGRQAVVRRSAGYQLDIDVDDIDTHRLERHVTDGQRAAASGDQAGAVTAFGEAVGLANGPALGELLDHQFARTAATRLDELVLAAHTGLIDAELAVGRHFEVLPALTALVDAHPLWERFHAQLMTALYRCGRQSEALRAFRNARTTLIEEVGIEPGPELQALERAVLTHDTALSAPTSLRVAAPPQLPTFLTSFVGRGLVELTVLDNLMANARLVTVLGPGGAGKTRFVLEHLARRPADHETWFVELAPIVDALAVPEAIAAAIGAHDNGPESETARPPDVRSADRIGGREVLLVLDNCEHVVDAVARCVATLLATCPGLRIVATSRQPLDVTGEQQLPLEPLADDDASRLFTDRATAVRPTFAADGDAITDLCQRLDRLPLAIELAAARVKTLPVTEIVARLDNRFELLHGAGRTTVERHRGLGAAIDWSYDALFADERTVFCRLAVFVGGATIDAAEHVCGPGSLDVMTRLVDKSLVVADTSGPVARFRMLESLRDYGLDRLTEAGDLQDAVSAHRRWCVALAAAAERGVRRGDEQLAWLARLDAEHDNVRAALSRPDGGSGDDLRLIGALLLPWWLHDRRQEGRHWADTHLAAANGADRAVTAKVEMWCGLLASSTGWQDRTGGIEHELTLAARRQRDALEYFRGVGDTSAVADARLLLAFNIVRRAVAGMDAEIDEVGEHVRLMTAVFDAAGDDFGSALAHVTDAFGHLTRGDFRLAASANDAARHHARRSGERFCRARVAWIDGMLEAAAGRFAESYQHTEQCLRLHEELGMGQEVTAQAALLAKLADLLGQPALAEQWRTFVIGRNGGASRDDLLLGAAATNSQALKLRAARRFDAARDLHLDALAWYREAGATTAVAHTESALGYLAAHQGDHTTAAAHHHAALDAALASGQAAAIASAYEGLAAAALPADAETAATLLGAADALWRSSPGGGHQRPNRTDVIATIGGAGAALGEPAYRSAFDRGGAIAPADAAELARRVRRPVDRR